MALVTKTSLRNGWQQLRRGGALVGRVRSHFDVIGTAKAAGRGLADLLFPPSCACCGVELDEPSVARPDVRLCDDCFEQLEIFSEPMCVRCGAPLPGVVVSEKEARATLASLPTRIGCYHCARTKLWFDHTIAVGAYDGALREIVLRMKRVEGDALSIAMGRLLLDVRGHDLAKIEADVVAPIPSHWRRRVVHRTNSAAILAEILAGRLRVPLAERLLRRSRYTVRQSELSPTERWKNMRRAFSIRGGYHLNGAHVLLVDDVLRTGATCSQAARVLRRTGASKITVAVLARAMG